MDRVKRRGSRYRDDWGEKLRRDDAAIRVHPKRGWLLTAKGQGRVDPRAKPIETIADIEKEIQIPALHVTRGDQKHQRPLEERRRSAHLDERRVKKALGVRAPVTLGQDQPENAVTIHQILELPDATISGRRIDKKALRRDWTRALARASGKQRQAEQRQKARSEDERWAQQFGQGPAGEAWAMTLVLIWEALRWAATGKRPASVRQVRDKDADGTTFIHSGHGMFRKLTIVSPDGKARSGRIISNRLGIYIERTPRWPSRPA